MSTPLAALTKDEFLEAIKTMTEDIIKHCKETTDTIENLDAALKQEARIRRMALASAAVNGLLAYNAEKGIAFDQLVHEALQIADLIIERA